MGTFFSAECDFNVYVKSILRNYETLLFDLWFKEKKALEECAPNFEYIKPLLYYLSISLGEENT